MALVRPATKARIQSILDESFFTSHGFSVDYENIDSYSTVILKIIFKADEDYYFKITDVKSNVTIDTDFCTTEAPGVHLVEEDEFYRNSFDDCLLAISKWIERIVEDYGKASTINEQLENLRASFEDHLRDSTEDLNENFSESEYEELKIKLDGLAKQLETLQSQLEINDSELEEMKEEIQKLKENIKKYPKGVWYRSAGNKVLSMIGHFIVSDTGRELIGKGISTLFLGEASLD